MTKVDVTQAASPPAKMNRGEIRPPSAENVLKETAKRGVGFITQSRIHIGAPQTAT